MLSAIERDINGLTPPERVRVRQERSRSLVTELQTWLYEQRTKLSRNNDTSKAIHYILSRWDAFTRFLDDGRLCMSKNAAGGTGHSPVPTKAAVAQLPSTP